jgi:hypothetical protein
MQDNIELVQDLLGQMRPGSPRSEGALTLVPFFASAPAKDYLIASEAIESGLLKIGEVGSGEVPNVVVQNSADLPVLLLDGEHIEGARQSRILNVTALVAAGKETLLPVSCVEQGRWGYTGTQSFAPSPDHAYSRLRRAQAEMSVAAVSLGHERRPDQGAVWQEVAQKHAETGARSDTGAMRDSFERQRHALTSITRAFGRPEPGQTGVLACIGGEPVVLDAFDRPETLYKMWQRLISGYALDAIGVRTEQRNSGAADRFLGEAARGDFLLQPSIGIGEDVVVSGGEVVGNALAWDGGVVHLALFGRTRPPRRSSGGGRMASPTSRRQRRGHFHA